MKFNPNTGKPMMVHYTPQEFCKAFPHLDWRFDPATGLPRAYGTDTPLSQQGKGAKFVADGMRAVHDACVPPVRLLTPQETRDSFYIHLSAEETKNATAWAASCAAQDAKQEKPVRIKVVEPLPATPDEIVEGLAWVESLRAAQASSGGAPVEIKIGDSILGKAHVYLHKRTAPDILTAAAKHMADRAKTYDKTGGERSMGQVVTAFNAIAGRDLQESEGWLLMQILKDVRDRQRAEPHVDSLEDCVAYAALKAESRMGGR